MLAGACEAPGIKNFLLRFSFSQICISILKVPFPCFAFCYLSAPSMGSLKRPPVQYLRQRIFPASCCSLRQLTPCERRWRTFLSAGAHVKARRLQVGSGHANTKESGVMFLSSPPTHHERSAKQSMELMDRRTRSFLPSCSPPPHLGHNGGSRHILRLLWNYLVLSDA